MSHLRLVDKEYEDGLIQYKVIQTSSIQEVIEATEYVQEQLKEKLTKRGHKNVDNNM